MISGRQLEQRARFLGRPGIDRWMLIQARASYVRRSAAGDLRDLRERIIAQVGSAALVLRPESCEDSAPQEYAGVDGGVRGAAVGLLGPHESADVLLLQEP